MAARWLASAAVLVSLGSGAGAGAQQKGTAHDARVREQAEHRLFEAGLVGAMVTVEDGTATLTGTLPSLWARDEAVRLVRKVKGAKTVVSTLTVRPGESDAMLADAISNELSGSELLTIFDTVNAVVMDGAATVTGYVTSDYKAQGLARAVSRVEGLQQVVNHIEVLPLSRMDDQIRQLVASRIYSGALYPHIGSQATAPVHIIVKNGHVTLAGMVGSEMDRRLAEMLAREVPGVFGVVNDLDVNR